MTAHISQKSSALHYNKSGGDYTYCDFVRYKKLLAKLRHENCQT
jgi:hypothetical protein